METKFEPLFDYNSIFKYESITPFSKGVNRTQYRSPFTYHSINIDSFPNAGEEVEGKENYFISVLRKSITALSYIIFILTFPFSVWVCVKKVHALERIVLMRLGKLQAIKGPGFAFILPIVDTWTRVDLRTRRLTVSTPQVLTADGGILEIMSDIEYQVSDVLSYVMKLSKQEKTLKELGSLCLRNMVSEKDQEDLENKKELVSSILKDELNQSFINWGLEVLHVHLHSPTILKHAEPVDAVGTLLNALKAATGNSPTHMAAIFPVLPNMHTEERKSGILHCSQNANVIDTLKCAVADAEMKGLLGDLTANFKFDIVGISTNTVYCSFKNGHASILSSPTSGVESDVSLIVTEDNLKDFLSGVISPLQAYMDGKVMVTGDWSLLRPLARILEALHK